MNKRQKQKEDSAKILLWTFYLTSMFLMGLAFQSIFF